MPTTRPASSRRGPPLSPAQVSAPPSGRPAQSAPPTWNAEPSISRQRAALKIVTRARSGASGRRRCRRPPRPSPRWRPLARRRGPGPRPRRRRRPARRRGGPAPAVPRRGRRPPRGSRGGRGSRRPRCARRAAVRSSVPRSASTAPAGFEEPEASRTQCAAVRTTVGAISVPPQKVLSSARRRPGRARRSRAMSHRPRVRRR